VRVSSDDKQLAAAISLAAADVLYFPHPPHNPPFVSNLVATRGAYPSNRWGCERRGVRPPSTRRV
jgi:hypothetical protein